jgi:hypothetical protein
VSCGEAMLMQKFRKEKQQESRIAEEKVGRVSEM